jgi:hypothetical protein
VGKLPARRKTVKIAFIVLCFAASAFAQKLPGTVPVACGPNDVDFKVKLNDAAPAVVQPGPGKALVYFIHDAGSGMVFAYPTLKMGVDGAWVGANHGDSWFSVNVDPGEHHVCATLQSSIVEDRAEFVHFQAETGQVYYYRTRLVMSKEVELLELEPIDSDQGKYLIASYPLSVSRSKKK